MSTAEETIQMDEAAGAMRKLTRTHVPFKYLKKPFQLASLKADLERLRTAVKINTEASFLGRIKAKLMPGKSLADLPVERQIEMVGKRVESLEKDFVDAVLTPLTEAEVWEVRVEFGAIYNSLLKRSLAFEGAAKQAFMEEVKGNANALWISKWVGLALKKKDQVDGRWVRYTDKLDTLDVEPPTLNAAFELYHQSFTLTDDEIKKAAAPMIPTRSQN